ncbi:MAG: 30S ribosomal protein S15 [Candidatus Woesearchaeota archaeon]|nr:MAG: 30S ribosomal protein S15 [Candidatus Woesearchaeota archaeon]
MSRLYSRKKGKAGRTRPPKADVPSWLTVKPKEVELLVLKNAKAGLSASQIGILLRDSYGVPEVRNVTGKKITQILVEKEVAPPLPEDLFSLIKKAVQSRKHLESNHKDMTAKRGLQLTESKIRRLAKYYKRTEKLASDWKYDPEKVKLLVS